MRRTVLFAALLLGTAACGGRAPEPLSAPPTPAAGPIEPPPVYALIGNRAQLDLTSEQIAALDSIGNAVNSQNNPLVRRLRELRGDFRVRGDSPLDEDLPPVEEARALADRIRQNNREAQGAVREVLTPQQQTRTCEIFRETEARRLEMRRQMGQQRGAGARQRTAQATAELPPIWPWCGPAPAAPDTAAPEAPADTTGA